jgi:hypothetical protein
MKATQQLVLVLAMLVCISGQLMGQATPGDVPVKKPTVDTEGWEFNLTVEGYIIPDGISYVDPVFSADYKKLHLEGRYNYENLHTGSTWVGYNYNHGSIDDGDTWEFDVTPMIGGVFGRTNGIAPGCEVSLQYKTKIEFSITNEYVFDTTSKSGNFYYAWPQLTYSPKEWLHLGAVAQHTAAYHTPVNIQRGFLVGFSYKNWEYTTYVFNPGIAGTTVVLEGGVRF